MSAYLPAETAPRHLGKLDVAVPRYRPSKAAFLAPDAHMPAAHVNDGWSGSAIGTWLHYFPIQFAMAYASAARQATPRATPALKRSAMTRPFAISVQSMNPPRPKRPRRRRLSFRRRRAESSPASRDSTYSPCSYSRRMMRMATTTRSRSSESMRSSQPPSCFVASRTASPCSSDRYPSA